MSTIDSQVDRKTRVGVHVLFYTRLFLYLLVFAIPIFHPAVVVPYGKMGYWLWFGILPLEMLMAFYLRPPRLNARAWVVAATLPILLTVIFLSGISTYSLIYIGVGAAAFLVTAAIFHGGPWGKWLAIPEPFLLAILYYKMLSFSRASQAIAQQSQGITQVLLAVAVAAFLLHNLVLYSVVYRPRGSHRGGRELAIFLSVVIPAVLAVAILLPANFVSNTIVLNNLDGKVKPKPMPLDLSANGLPGGNLRALRDYWNKMGYNLGNLFGGYGNGSQSGNNQSQQGGTAALEGIPANQWGSGQTASQGPGKQYAVMVVASPVDPTYSAEAYYGKLNPVAGFEKTPNQPLNDLTFRRLVTTWQNTEPNNDMGRQPVNISYLSTLPDRDLAYRPQSVEPTVLNNRYYPFSYSYDSVSMMDTVSPLAWQGLPSLTPAQKKEFAPYLSVPLSAADRQAFQSFLNKHVGDTQGYFPRLLAILKGFSTYQYQVGFTNDVAVQHLVNFLTKTKTGDCVEFSNTTAILARMEGIPSRVVTGYLAAKQLQTPATLRGLQVLRQQIKPLQKYPLNELYLVTTADHHSWVQVWLPSYGWVDIETTSFAIPPAAGGDPNNWNVVIPLISSQENPAAIFHFPWRPVLAFLGMLALLGLVGTYTYRWGRELYLLNLSRGRGKRSVDALYKLLLLRLAENGFEIKSPARTPKEFAGDHPELAGFAELYTELRFRERFGPGEHEGLWRKLKTEYRSVLRSCRKRGLAGAFGRAFSLRGLYYRW